MLAMAHPREAKFKAGREAGGRQEEKVGMGVDRVVQNEVFL